MTSCRLPERSVEDLGPARVTCLEVSSHRVRLRSSLVAEIERRDQHVEAMTGADYLDKSRWRASQPPLHTYFTLAPGESFELAHVGRVTLAAVEQPEQDVEGGPSIHAVAVIELG